MEIYEIDDSGHTPGRKLRTQVRKVRGHVVGCFGIRRWNGSWRVDHIPTGVWIHDFSSPDVAAFVCVELICRASWNFTAMPTGARRVVLSDVFHSVVMLGEGL